MQPYLLAFCERKPDKRLTRSVLTAVARVGPGKTLFAACKHGITQTTDLMIINEAGIPLPHMRHVLIPTPRIDLDLAFLLLHHNVDAARIAFNTSPIRQETLSHARNVFASNVEASPFRIHTATAKDAGFKAQLGWSAEDTTLRFKHLKKKEEVKEAQRTGTTVYPILEMESWPGVSGSALWDKSGTIRGMVCGGDRNGDDEEKMLTLVYIPANLIAKEMHKLLQNPQFIKLASQ